MNNETKKLVGYIITLLSTVVLLYLSSLDIALSQQIEIGAVLTLVVIGLILSPLSRFLEIRLIIFLLGSFLATRYIYWRTTNTIIFTNLYDFIPMILLYMAEVYSYLIFTTGLFINVMPLDRDIYKPFLPQRYPSVDVLIPTYNEPLEIVKITATGAKLIDYPKDKINIFILDDGATHQRINSKDPEIRLNALKRKEELENFCKDKGIKYLTRKDNNGAKAGNINAALTQCSGELVLILDCDHVPTRDILKRTVGFFEKDEKIFLVQTPHFMINANPLEKNLRLFADAPPEYEMFYGVIQKGLDFWNSSFFCGSAAILKRKYLDDIGGIQGQTVTEDAETSLELHARGLRSVYFSAPLTSGLSPETFMDFINQRIRWAQGMIQIILLKKPLFKRGLKLYQRISYTNVCIFWLFGLARTIFIFAPMVYLVLGMRIYMATVPQVLAYALPFLACSFYISNYLFGKYRWPLFSELYETAQSIFLLPATLAVLLNPKKPKFKVTPKGQSLAKDFLSPLGWPFAFIFLACLLSIPFAYYRWIHYPAEHDVIIVCTVWMIFHILILIMCLGSIFERHQLRRHPRTWASGNISVEIDGQILKGEVLDLSLGGIGAIFKNPPNFKTGQTAFLRLQDSYGNKYKFKAILKRYSGSKGNIKLSFQFLQESETDFENLVAYVYGDSNRWLQYQQRKRKAVPTIQGSMFLIRHGVSTFKETAAEFGAKCIELIHNKLAGGFKTLSGYMLAKE